MKRYFFVGIGGIGMSALAQYLHARGHTVSGSDRDDSPTVELLKTKGISVRIGHAPLTEDVDVLVYSDAIPETAPERHSATERGIEQRSYFALLGEVSASMKTIAIAGTHGKTTTTGMLTKILVEADKHPTAIIGSIVRDFGSNCVLGSDEVFVVEACEYKNHLLNFKPDVLVITNIELDHTDFFTDLEHLQDTFKKAVMSVKEGGVIVTNPTHAAIAPVLMGTQCTIVDYTKEDVGQISHIGGFNRENAQAARAAARVIFADITDVEANSALYDFKGSWRRFEYKGETERGASVYDDYAHHPTAVEKTIHAAKERFQGKKIIVAFHPHLYSRTKHFREGFALALSHADEVIIAPIYAARENHDPSISHVVLADMVRQKGGCAHAADSLATVRTTLEHFDESAVIITMGAGDIYKVADELVA